ncbi:MAG: RNA-binding S4 domain-containing protein [Bacilli bacterium]|nr:RNA-binding S4 domain-containing protein [Bacilli bacterium]
MRIDKFLKVSRLIKRRSVAKDASNEEKIVINGKVAKPSTDVKVGDVIEIHYYKSILKVKVINILNSSKKEDAESMYEVLSLEEIKRETTSN